MIQSGPGPMPSFQEFVIKFFDKRKFLASFRNLPLKRSKEEDSSLVIHLTWSISVDSLRQFEANAKLAKVANNFIFQIFYVSRRSYFRLKCNAQAVIFSKF